MSSNKLKINTDALENAGRQFSQLDSSLDSIVQQINSALNQTRFAAPTQTNIINSISSLKKRTGSAATYSGKVATNVGKAAVMWTDVEKRIGANSGNSVNGSDGGNGGGGTDTADWQKLFNKLIGKVGLIGGILSPLANIYTKWSNGDMDAGDWVSVFKDGLSFAKGIYNIGDNVKKLSKLARMNPGGAQSTFLKRLFGLNKFTFTPSKAKDFGTRFYNNFQKQKGIFDDYTAGGAKSFFAWAGLGLSALSNGISNYEEYKSGQIGAGRAVAETVVETAVDVGKDWLIGAAVTAGVAAIIPGAPVIVAGVATVLVTKGLDMVSEYFFDKPVTELISDAVVDVGEYVVKGTKKVVSDVVTTASNLWDGAKRGFKSLFSW